MPGIFRMLALPCGVLKKLPYRYSVKICGMYIDLQVFCIAFIAFPMEIELKIMLAGYPVGKACPNPLMLSNCHGFFSLAEPGHK